MGRVDCGNSQTFSRVYKKIERKNKRKNGKARTVSSFVLEPHAFPDENESVLKHDSTSGEALGESGLS